MVLEHAVGAVIGIEVKAAKTVRAEDFRSLRHLTGSDATMSMVVGSGEAPNSITSGSRYDPL
jgi:hypothetical protein